MIVVVIVPSGFRDRMYCRSLHLVIAHPMCPPTLDSVVMIPHLGFCGRWPIALSSSSIELGNRGIGAGSQFQGVLAPIPARYSALWTGVSSRRRYLGGREREEKDRDTHPYRGKMGRAKAGIVRSTIPASWTAGLRKWYFQLKK